MKAADQDLLCRHVMRTCRFTTLDLKLASYNSVPSEHWHAIQLNRRAGWLVEMYCFSLPGVVKRHAEVREQKQRESKVGRSIVCVGRGCMQWG